MTTEDVFTQITPIFRDIFDDDDLVPTAEMSAKDVAEWDSLHHIRLIVTIEKVFKIKFSTAEISGFQNVGHLVQSILERANPS